MPRGSVPPSFGSVGKRDAPLEDEGGTEPALLSFMHAIDVDTGVEDKDLWRARILRALHELRGDDDAATRRVRRDETRDGGNAEEAKP